MYEKKKWKMIEKHNKYMEHNSSELDRFCDFLGNIITKYIHEIDLKNVFLIEENNNEEERDLQKELEAKFDELFRTNR